MLLLLQVSIYLIVGEIHIVDVTVAFQLYNQMCFSPVFLGLTHLFLVADEQLRQ